MLFCALDIKVAGAESLSKTLLHCIILVLVQPRKMSRHDLKIDNWDTNPNKIQFGSKHKTGNVKFQSNADFYFPLK